MQCKNMGPRSMAISGAREDRQDGTGHRWLHQLLDGAKLQRLRRCDPVTPLTLLSRMDCCRRPPVGLGRLRST